MSSITSSPAPVPRAAAPLEAGTSQTKSQTEARSLDGTGGLEPRRFQESPSSGPSGPSYLANRHARLVSGGSGSQSSSGGPSGLFSFARRSSNGQPVVQSPTLSAASSQVSLSETISDSFSIASTVVVAPDATTGAENRTNAPNTSAVAAVPTTVTKVRKKTICAMRNKPPFRFNVPPSFAPPSPFDCPLDLLDPRTGRVIAALCEPAD